MTDLTSIPVLMADNVVAFGEPKDLGLVLASLHNNGTCWIFIGGADTLRMQVPVRVTLGLRGLSRPTVDVECTPRYQSPGAVGCEVRLEDESRGRAEIDALLAVIAAGNEGRGAPPVAADPSAAGSNPPFSEQEATAPEMDFVTFARPDEPTGKIDAGFDASESVPATAAELVPTATQESAPAETPLPKPGVPAPAREPVRAARPGEAEAPPDTQGALSYRVMALHGVDQLLGLAGGLKSPTPMGAEAAGEEERPHLLLTLFEFLGMKHFTGVVTIEWKDGRPVESTVLHIRKGDLIRQEDRGGDAVDAEESFLQYLIKEKAVVHHEVEDLRQKREETGKSIGNLLFEAGYLTLDRISASMRSHKEESFFDLLFREGAGIARVRPKPKMKGHPIRVNITRNCIVWVRKVLLDQYRRNLDPYLAQWMQSYPVVNQEATKYPLMWLLKAQKEAKTAETVLTGAVLAQECFDMAPVSQHDLARLFFLLTRYGALEWRDLPKASTDSKALTPDQQLEAHLSYLRESNPFTRLGVHWATHPTDIEAKFGIIQRKYAPESRLARYSDRSRAVCQEISDLLRTSRDRLMDRRSRVEERGRIVEESQGRFAAQFMEKQARIIKFRGELTLAIQTLEMAIEIFPDPRWMAMLKIWKAEKKG
jgi:hypothetical protein